MNEKAECQHVPICAENRANMKRNMKQFVSSERQSLSTRLISPEQGDEDVFINFLWTVDALNLIDGLHLCFKSA